MKSVLKNVSWLFLAQVCTKSIAFFYTLFLARFLGVSQYGLYTAAIAYFALASAVVDFGLNRYLIREVSRHQSAVFILSIKTAILRLCLAGLVGFVLIIWLAFFDTDFLRRNLSILAILAIFPQALALTFDGALIALQRVKISAIGAIFLSIINTILGVVLVSQFGVNGIVYSLITAICFQVIFLYWNLNKLREETNEQFSFPQIISGSAPYAMMVILGLIFFRIDALFLSYMKGSVETGLYGAAYRFLEAVTIIPTVVFNALFPVISRLNSEAKIQKIYFSSLVIFGLVSIPFTLGFELILPLLFGFILPKYNESIPLLRILGLSIPFMFLQASTTTLLMSKEKLLKGLVIISVVTVSFNIGANYIFIPIYGATAAAWVTTASEAISCIIFSGFCYFKLLRK